jgi:hypothetical protein
VFKKTLNEKTATGEKKICWNARKQKQNNRESRDFNCHDFDMVFI